MFDFYVFFWFEGGRGKVSHKGRRRHFTDEEDLKQDLEKAKREQEWRVSCCC